MFHGLMVQSDKVQVTGVHLNGCPGSVRTIIALAQERINDSNSNHLAQELAFCSFVSAPRIRTFSLCLATPYYTQFTV